ncbi:formin [Trypanosoma conorhini]|uniref:Formin n=1 Tax=Trypanosoma conorhini TaxID=83891 RepID=A0A422PY73_9TRYP|nr:formin [Trypanosoma conorhini]RNF22709.1 formin [Trypanosoma conorhini]
MGGDGAESSPEGFPSTNLVDPAVEASLFPRLSGGRRSQHPDGSAIEEPKTQMVHISRPAKTASWGFLTYSNCFPLRVGDVTSPRAASLKKGDEIVEINKAKPKDYEDAMQLFQRARLNLELRLCRRSVGGKHPHVVRSHSTGSSDVTTPADAAGGVAAAVASPSLPGHQGGTEATLSPFHETPRTRPGEGRARYSAEMALEKLLREGGANGFGGDSAAELDGTLSPLPEAFSAAVDDDIVRVWSRVFSRKRARTSDGHAESHYAEVSGVLPRPVRQAIYDRSSCPFSAEEGFTSEFHAAVQHTLTASALSNGRELNSQGTAKAALMASHGSQPRSVEAVVEGVKRIDEQREEEVARSLAAKGAAQCNEELDASHHSMLRVVASHRHMREEKRRYEEEKYRQTEATAKKFLLQYMDATSSSRSMPGVKQRSRRGYHHVDTHDLQRYELPSPPPPVAGVASGCPSTPPPLPPPLPYCNSFPVTEGTRHAEGYSSRLLRLPTPPPPPPPPPLPPPP